VEIWSDSFSARRLRGLRLTRTQMEVHVHLKNAFPGGIGNRTSRLAIIFGLPPTPRQGGLQIKWDRMRLGLGVFRLDGTGWDWDRVVFRLGGTGWDWDRRVFQLNQSTCPKVGLQGCGPFRVSSFNGLYHNHRFPLLVAVL